MCVCVCGVRAQPFRTKRPLFDTHTHAHKEYKAHSACGGVSNGRLCNRKDVKDTIRQSDITIISLLRRVCRRKYTLTHSRAACAREPITYIMYYVRVCAGTGASV